MSESLDLLGGPFESDESYSLIVLRDGNDILLGRKSRGFGQGKLVLPGGKNHYYLGGDGIGIVPGPHGASRELAQETGVEIDPQGLALMGMLHIVNDESETRDVEVYTGNISDYSSLRSSDELLDVHMYGIGAVSYAEMPGDYGLWLPQILAGYSVNAFIFTDGNEIAGSEVYYQRLQPLGRMQMSKSGL